MSLIPINTYLRKDVSYSHQHLSSCVSCYPVYVVVYHLFGYDNLNCKYVLKISNIAVFLLAQTCRYCLIQLLSAVQYRVVPCMNYTWCAAAANAVAVVVNVL
jgi:hypothetical protein